MKLKQAISQYSSISASKKYLTQAEAIFTNVSADKGEHDLIKHKKQLQLQHETQNESSDVVVEQQ